MSDENQNDDPVADKSAEMAEDTLEGIAGGQTRATLQPEEEPNLKDELVTPEGEAASSKIKWTGTATDFGA